VVVKEEVNAKKDTYGEARALELVESVSEVFSARGKKVVHFDLKKDAPSKDELKKALLGPTGNLRAPTLRKGRTLIVGFDDETYRKLMG
jgi:arsenate reductase-like glutaredoxin family protein